MKSFYEFTTFNDEYKMYFSDDRWNLFATSSTLDYTYDFTFNEALNSIELSLNGVGMSIDDATELLNNLTDNLLNSME